MMTSLIACICARAIVASIKLASIEVWFCKGDKEGAIEEEFKMAEAVGRHMDNVKQKEPSEKRMPRKNIQGEDCTDAAPSNKAPLGLDLVKEIVSIIPTPEDQVHKVGSTDVEMKESEDSTDAVPSNRPTAKVSAVQKSNPPIQERPQRKQEPRTGPSSVTGPGPRSEDGAMHGAEGNTARQQIDMEEKKDFILYETADKVAGSCDLRSIALRLPSISEHKVAQIEHDNPKLKEQFYQVFQLLSRDMPTAEMFTKLLEALVKTNQRSAAKWLRECLGIKEPEASLEGETSSSVSDEIQTGGNDTFYDIFLMHTGKSEFTRKFQNICDRNKWVVKTSDTIPATAPVHAAIEDILYTSTHLALLITDEDCRNYKARRNEMCMTVEMALQLDKVDHSLAGKVLPIRCCEKTSLPLVLRALTGAHIHEDSFEDRLVATIDTETRLKRMKEQN